MFIDQEREVLTELAVGKRRLATQIDRIADYTGDSVTEVLDIIGDIRRTTLREENILRLIQESVKARLWS